MAPVLLSLATKPLPCETKAAMCLLLSANPLSCEIVLLGIFDLNAESNIRNRIYSMQHSENNFIKEKNPESMFVISL